MTFIESRVHLITMVDTIVTKVPLITSRREQARRGSRARFQVDFK